MMITFKDKPSEQCIFGETIPSDTIDVFISANEVLQSGFKMKQRSEYMNKLKTSISGKVKLK